MNRRRHFSPQLNRALDMQDKADEVRDLTVQLLADVRSGALSNGVAPIALIGPRHIGAGSHMAWIRLGNLHVMVSVEPIPREQFDRVAEAMAEQPKPEDFR